MAPMCSTVSAVKEVTTDGPAGPREILHWYDFLCPFCYVGQQRNGIFEAYGLHVAKLPFQAHPDIPVGGRVVGERSGPMYARIEREAQAADLPLVWPARLPDTRLALAAAEWKRRQAPSAFTGLETALFAAHFALGENLGDSNVIDHHASEAGVDLVALHGALDDGSAYALVDRSETLARRLGVRGTPAWFVEGRLVEGLHPREQFGELARALTAPEW